MRRTILFALFLLAACGGDVRSTGAVNRSVDLRAEAQRLLLTAEARSAIAEWARTSSQDALDTCLNAWLQGFGEPGDINGPVAKPDVAGLRFFLSQCLGGAVPGDARTQAVGDARAVRAVDLRITRATDLRSSFPR